jgi:hypothetical protein
MVGTASLTVARRVYWLCGQPRPDTQRAEPYREAISCQHFALETCSPTIKRAFHGQKVQVLQPPDSPQVDMV